MKLLTSWRAIFKCDDRPILCDVLHWKERELAGARGVDVVGFFLGRKFSPVACVVHTLVLYRLDLIMKVFHTSDNNYNDGSTLN